MNTEAGCSLCVKPGSTHRETGQLLETLMARKFKKLSETTKPWWQTSNPETSTSSPFSFTLKILFMSNQEEGIGTSI